MTRRHVRRALVPTGALLGAIAMLTATAAGARAAEYTVYGASDEHPSVSSFQAASGDVVIAAIVSPPTRISAYAGVGAGVPSGDEASWTLAAPGAATVSDLSMELACDSRNGWETGLYYRLAGGDYDDQVPVDVAGEETALCYEGEYASWQQVTASPSFPEISAMGIQLRAHCANQAGCTGSGSGGPGSVSAKSFSVTIDDPAPPAIDSVTGSFFDGGPLSGSVPTSFVATDPEAGIATARLYLDGANVGSVSGTCAADNVPPCNPQLTGTIYAYGSSLAVGSTHTAALTVEDYAGNTTTSSSLFTVEQSQSSPDQSLGNPPDPERLEALARSIEYVRRRPTVSLNKTRRRIRSGDRIRLSGTYQGGGAIRHYSGKVLLQLSTNRGRKWKTLRSTRIRKSGTSRSFNAHVRVKTRARNISLSAALVKEKGSEEVVERSNALAVRVRTRQDRRRPQRS